MLSAVKSDILFEKKWMFKLLSLKKILENSYAFSSQKTDMFSIIMCSQKMWLIK